MCKRLVVKIENPDLNKRRCMELIDSELQIPELRPFDCPDVIRHVTQKLGRRVTLEDVVDALDMIVTYINENEIHSFKVNITERNNSLRPAKEMSIEDIEKELGYKIKIVSDDESKEMWRRALGTIHQ